MWWKIRLFLLNKTSNACHQAIHNILLAHFEYLDSKVKTDILWIRIFVSALVYNTFLASRQILLSHDIYLSSITFPKIHLFNNPNSWFVFRNQKCELYQSSKYVNAIIASKQAVDKGGDPQEPHFFVMHTGVWNLVLDFGSGKGTYGPNFSEFLIHPTGGSYPIPPVNDRWEAFPLDLVQTMHDLVSTNERRKVFQNILKSAGKDLSGESSFRLLSSSAKYWLPSKKLLSFLPEGISLEVDSDIIQNIYLGEAQFLFIYNHAGV